MSWRIEWSHAGVVSLRSIPWRHAERVDAAVQRLAREHEGDLVRVKDNPIAARLRVPPYIAYITLDPHEGLLTVWYVYRS